MTMTENHDHRGIADEVKDRVVEMYLGGSRTQDITAETGIERPTIYWILNQRGLTPTRTRRQRADTMTSAQLMEQLAAAHRTIGRLEVELELCLRRCSDLDHDDSDKESGHMPT